MTKNYLSRQWLACSRERKFPSAKESIDGFLENRINKIGIKFMTKTNLLLAISSTLSKKYYRKSRPLNKTVSFPSKFFKTFISSIPTLFNLLLVKFQSTFWDTFLTMEQSLTMQFLKIQKISQAKSWRRERGSYKTCQVTIQLSSKA